MLKRRLYPPIRVRQSPYDVSTHQSQQLGMKSKKNTRANTIYFSFNSPSLSSWCMYSTEYGAFQDRLQRLIHECSHLAPLSRAWECEGARTQAAVAGIAYKASEAVTEWRNTYPQLHIDGHHITRLEWPYQWNGPAQSCSWPGLLPLGRPVIKNPEFDL